MKKLTLVFGAFAMVAIIGCSESTVATDSDKQDNNSSGFGTSGVSAGYQSPIHLKKTGEMIQDKPLTVIDFTAEVAQPIDGLASEGVTYSYTVGGNPSTAGMYGWYAAGPGDFYDPPMFESNGTGTLSITFDQPTDIVEFAVIISSTGFVAGGATVEVYGPNGKLRDTYVLDLDSSPFYSGAWFSYTKNAVKEVRITNNVAFEYAVDNITFHQGEE